MSELTPLMKQYYSIKESHQDCIVLFRLGDFYEMFGDDAKTASAILQITLTSRDKSSDEPIPMCGVPYFSVDAYITKLIKAGLKVAICEQTEDPRNAKGIVQRDVVKIITPGTHTPEEPRENYYIMSIFPERSGCGITVADLSTGEFMVYETLMQASDEAGRFSPREILCPASLKDNIHYQESLEGYYITYVDDWDFDYPEAYKTVLKYFRVASLEGFGCQDMPGAVSSAGALLKYLEETQKVLTFKKIDVMRSSSYMFLDTTTRRNLELTANLADGSDSGTLLNVIDETITPMGGRFMRSAISRPLLSVDDINKRLDAVTQLAEDYVMHEEIKSSLRKMHDIERLASKLIAGSINPRDLISLKNSAEYLPKLRKICTACQNTLINEQALLIGDFTEMTELITACIDENPPMNPRDSGVIKKGYSTNVDELRSISTSGKDFITKLEAKEKERTGISSLKVGFNKVFGYYIEITKANMHLAPAEYTRKQTLANCERFITPELKEYEGKVLGAEDRLKELENDIFNRIVASLQKYGPELLQASSAAAMLDFLTSLSTAAKRHDYNRPEINSSDIIEITDGRHPVIERILQQSVGSESRFIPNSVLVDSSENSLLMITGPNMAGKSTFMRQTALIVLMAQMGSFVPASSAKIGIADRIFTRIGASDHLAKGQSTFMVEMIETANILNNATNRSLILLDEVGRGTSTFDGISIAWAVAEYIVKKIRARTLFATHYHELTDLALTTDGIKNYNVLVKEWGDEIIFLRKIEKGPADKSYGIQVARLAGLADEVIIKAKEVLSELEKRESETFRHKPNQMDLFCQGDPLKAELMKLDTQSLTPQKAVKILQKLKSMAEGS
ncbi:MAG: DNA mismatch repair protein MutS [Dissulfurispiraceae bacterium]|nr:DNA mismatch repair protein MutS [Dissulfurispiraceae bacterium]